MPRLLHAALAGSLLTFAAAAPAAAQSESPESIIAEHSETLTLRAGRVRGPGASTLRRELKAATILCIGESHLNEQTPAFIEAILPWLTDAGYTALAIETGTTEAEHLEQGLKTDPDALTKSMATAPFSIPFYDHAAEFNMLREAVEAGIDLWGLDQVFVGGVRVNMQILGQLAETDEQRETAVKLFKEAQAAFRTFATTGDGSQDLMVAATASDYRKLRGVFDGNQPALDIIHEIESSAEIYRLFRAGENYQSNHTRINLMKSHFADGINALDPDAKVVLKFGSVHMGRGYSPLNQLDLGNAAAEIAITRGGPSLHLLIAAGDAEHDPMPMLAEASGIDDDWRLIDLRPLRDHFHTESNAQRHPELAELVWRYDMVALAPTFTPAERLPGVPAPPGR